MATKRGALLTIAEVAERLRRSEEHIRRLIRARKLAGIKDGRAWSVAEVDLDAYLDRQRQAAQV